MKKLRIGVVSLLVLFTTSAKAQSTTWVNKMMSGDYTYKQIQDQFYTDWEGLEYSKGHGWKQFKRWEYFWSTRLMPDGSFPDYTNELESFNDYKSEHTTRSVDGGNWSPLGPSSYTTTESWSPGLGRVNFVVEDPNLASTLYIGTPGGGAWKSTNSGTSWTPLSDNLSSIGISAIAVAKTNSQIIYMATGDADGGDTQSIRVVKSTDGGSTWEIVGSTTDVPGQLADILVDPTNADVVYVASKTAGIYKTTNGGTNWTEIKSGDYRDIEFKPENSQVIYAAGSSDIQVSTNGGTNWTMSTGIPSGMSRIALAVTPADDSYVYALVANGSGGYQGVYRSTNSGSAFVARNTTTDCFEGDQSWYDMAIGVSATNKELIFTGVLNVWKSTDGGSSLSVVNSWSDPNDQAYTHADIHFVRYYGGNLYCGSDGGIYKSTNDGTAFTDLSNGLQIGQFYRICGVENNVNTITGGLQDNGNYYRSGSTWRVWLGADGMENAINPANPLEAYGMIQNGGLYKTSDGGLTSEDIGNPGIDGEWVTPMVYDAGSGRILAGYDKIYQYNGSWSALSTFDFGGNLNCLEVAPSNSQIIYSSAGAGIFKTINGGAAMTELTSNLAAINVNDDVITSIEIHKTDPNKIWVSIGGMSSGVKVAKSTNGGTTWTNVTGTLPNLPCNIVKLDATSSETDAIYVGLDVGVYCKDATHSDFIPFMTNLPMVKVMDIEINETNNKVRVGTYGRGVWESATHSSTVIVNAALTVSSSTGCTGQTVIYTSTSTGATSYVWNFGANATPATANTEGPHSVTYSVGGSKTVILSINSNTSSSNSNVTINSTPTITAGLVTASTSCTSPSGSMLINGSGTGVVSWTGAATGNSGNITLPYTATSLTAGSYNVSFVNTSCTSNALTQVISGPTSPAQPTISAGGATTFCQGESVVLTSSQATGNVWSNGGATTQTLTANSTGSYSTTYTDGNGCSATSIITSVTVNPLPVITFNLEEKVCQEVTTNVSLTATPTGGTFSGTGVIGTNFNSATTGVCTFNIVYNFTDVNSCSNSETQSIEVESCLGVEANDLPTFKAYPNPIIEEFRIDVSGLNFEYYLTDVSGKVVHQGATYDAVIVNLSNNSSGIYFLTITVDGKSQTKKVLKK